MEVKWWDSSAVIVNVTDSYKGKTFKHTPPFTGVIIEFVCQGSFRYKSSTALIVDIDSRYAVWQHYCSSVKNSEVLGTRYP